MMKFVAPRIILSANIRGIALALLLMAMTGVCAASAQQTIVYEDADGDGMFANAATFAVPPEFALRAYELSKKPLDGQGQTFVTAGAGRMRGIGNHGSFMAFMKNNFAMLSSNLPACDSTILVDYVLSCPFSCVPTTDCTNSVNFVPSITCFNAPPCPGMFTCVAVDRIIGITTNQQACDCTPNCTLQAGTDVISIVASGPLCECYPNADSMIRNGAGVNPISLLAVNPPKLGAVHIETVNLVGTTGHAAAALFAYASPLSLFTIYGELLVNIADPGGELLGGPMATGPVATFLITVPNDISLAGLYVSTQALHVGGVFPAALSNALDLLLGF